MSKESIKQALKFCTVGVFNTLVDYVVFYIMLAAVNVDKIWAQVVATAVAMCGSYIVNKHWTFGEHQKSKKRQIAKFIVTNIVAMCCTIVFTSFLHDILHVHIWANGLLKMFGASFRLNEDMGVMLCKIIASVVSFAVNFAGNKFWVFKGAKSQENDKND